MEKQHERNFFLLLHFFFRLKHPFFLDTFQYCGPRGALMGGRTSKTRGTRDTRTFLILLLLLLFCLIRWNPSRNALRGPYCTVVKDL